LETKHKINLYKRGQLLQTIIHLIIHEAPVPKPKYGEKKLLENTFGNVKVQ